MRFAAATSTLFASMAYNASAFGVRHSSSIAGTTTFASSRIASKKRAFTSTASRLHANVLKLSEPKSQLLDEVDVFIFDCDGVIWRVRSSLLLV